MIVDGSGFPIFIAILVGLFILRKRYKEKVAKKKDEWLRYSHNNNNNND
ncbi:MAG: hypothetical protein M3270_04045 [Thermoproteota archaeon]|nr:hypothetical protein [Thermoproteota archaeon]